MSTITSLQGTDGITAPDSMIKINTNFENLNTDKIETSVLDTDTTLSANSDSKIATQKAVKTYIDTSGGANASETARGIVEEATDAEVTAGTATGGTGAKLVVTPAKLATRLTSLLKFGGTGADGALSITSGTTTIDCSNAVQVIKNYTSISITGTGKLAFSNPHANGTIIILKSQGAVTITSSTSPAIDVSSMGADGGAAGSGSPSDGSDGNAGNSNMFTRTVAGNNGGNSNSSYQGSASSAIGAFVSGSNKIIPLFTGSGGGGGGRGDGGNTGYGGGGGASATTGGTGGGGAGASGSGLPGAGGRGGGALLIECAGAYNCTSTLSAAGANGGNGSATNGPGGGGGGGGCLIVLYGSLTADSGTYTVAGGTGGTGAVNAGGDGGAGYSLRAVNTEFA